MLVVKKKNGCSVGGDDIGVAANLGCERSGGRIGVMLAELEWIWEEVEGTLMNNVGGYHGFC